MTTSNSQAIVVSNGSLPVPALIADQGQHTSKRFMEFFAARIRNQNTREAYARAWVQFAAWCEEHRLGLEDLEATHAAAYIEELTTRRSPPTVKLHLAALRTVSDYLVTGGTIPYNVFAPVRGPKHAAREGKTPALSVEQARALLDGIDTAKLAGLRDKALISTMLYSFARISAVLSMRVLDYRSQGRQAEFFFRREKGGKELRVPAHHQAAEAVDAYIEVAGFKLRSPAPLFQSTRGHKLTGRALSRKSAWSMVQRRARDAELELGLCNHSFRATGITAFLRAGGSLEHAAHIAGHALTQTTRVYDRNKYEATIAEIEQIRF